MEDLMEHFSISIGQFSHVVGGCCIDKALMGCNLDGNGLQP